MAKGFKHLTKADRIKIEALLKAGHSIKEIADLLHVHRSTIYREVKRGYLRRSIQTLRQRNAIAQILPKISIEKI